MHLEHWRQTAVESLGNPPSRLPSIGPRSALCTSLHLINKKSVDLSQSLGVRARVPKNFQDLPLSWCDTDISDMYCGDNDDYIALGL